MTQDFFGKIGDLFFETYKRNGRSVLYTISQNNSLLRHKEGTSYTYYGWNLYRNHHTTVQFVSRRVNVR